MFLQFFSKASRGRVGKTAGPVEVGLGGAGNAPAQAVLMEDIYGNFNEEYDTPWDRIGGSHKYG